MRLHKLLLVGGFISTSLLSGFPAPAIPQALNDATKIEIHNRVEKEIDQSLGAMRWSITFVLAVLGITPIFVGVSFLLLRGGIIRQLILASQSQLDEVINSEIKGRFNVELERQKDELTQRTEELLISTQERFNTLESNTRSEHDGLLEEMTEYLKRLQAIAASQKDPKLYEEIKSKFLDLKGVERPSSVRAYSYSDFLTQGLISHVAGHYDTAITFFEYAINIEPLNSKALIAKGDALYRLGNFTEAIAIYQKAIQANPSDFEALTYIGNPYSRLKQYQEAVTAFNAAIEINPNYPYSWYYLSRCYAVQGKFQLMFDVLSKAISLNPICSDMAINDPEFNQYRETLEFKELVTKTV